MRFTEQHHRFEPKCLDSQRLGSLSRVKSSSGFSAGGGSWTISSVRQSLEGSNRVGFELCVGGSTHKPTVGSKCIFRCTFENLFESSKPSRWNASGDVAVTSLTNRLMNVSVVEPFLRAIRIHLAIGKNYDYVCFFHCRLFQNA